MSYKCPYDGVFCEKQKQRQKEWREAVEYMAENRINHVFLTSASMFDNCPEKHIEQCERYRDYVYKEAQGKTK